MNGNDWVGLFNFLGKNSLPTLSYEAWEGALSTFKEGLQPVGTGKLNLSKTVGFFNL